jgi:hypothetical protein
MTNEENRSHDAADAWDNSRIGRSGSDPDLADEQTQTDRMI